MTRTQQLGYLLAAFLLGYALAPSGTGAQPPARLFGTSSTGAAVPIQTTGTALNVSVQ